MFPEVMISGGLVMAWHLPALQVVIPLLAAPMCVLLRSERLIWCVALLVSALCFAIAIALGFSVLAQGPISYALGGWAPPWGIEYRIDALNALVLIVICTINLLALIAARTFICREIDHARQRFVYPLWLLCVTGLLGVVITGDAFNVFVFLEISSLATYMLVALGPGRQALLAAFRYLVMGTIGATFFLIGIGLLYVQSGTLNMVDLAQRLPETATSAVSLAALALIIVGMGLKAALFPLHAWLPEAYSSAPSAVAVFIAGSSTKAAVYVIARFLYAILGADESFADQVLAQIIIPLALGGALFASVVAIFADDLKRLLAWSSIAQVGYMLLGLALATLNALTGALIHLFNHALLKSALFLVAANIAYRLGTTRLDALDGIGWRMPWTMAAFVAASLGLVGMPLTVGFISKWYLVVGAFDGGQTVVALGLLVSSLLSLVYLGRVVTIAYSVPKVPHSAVAQAGEVPPLVLVPLALLTFACVWFGIAPGFALALADNAAVMLLGGIER